MEEVEDMIRRGGDAKLKRGERREKARREEQHAGENVAREQKKTREVIRYNC